MSGRWTRCSLSLRPGVAQAGREGRRLRPNASAFSGSALAEAQRSAIRGVSARGDASGLAPDRTTPVQFQSAFAEIERQRELQRNLELARGLGLVLDYEVCDVTDLDQVERLVASTRSRWGGIDLVVHGAMVEHSVALAKKTPELIASTFATKVGGLVNLLRATRGEDPRFICFGSVAGILGNAGQTDYAAADTLMSAILKSHCQSARRCATIHWPAWRQAGAAAVNPDVEARLEAADVTAIWPDEGVYWFLQQVVGGGPDEVAILDEPMLNRWAWDTNRQRRIELDDTGRPLFAGRWPMVDRVDKSSETEIVVRRTLDPSVDRFLLQHRLRGVPTLPFTFGCELLAKRPTGVPWLYRHRVTGHSCRIADQAFRTETRRRSRTRIHRRNEWRHPSRPTGGYLRSAHRQSRPSNARVHYTGRVSLARQRTELSVDSVLQDFQPSNGGFIRSRSFFHLMDDPIRLGPAFDRAAWLRVSESRIAGTVQTRRQRDALSRTASPVFVLDPFGMDAALQIAASWDGYRNGWLSVRSRSSGSSWVGRGNRQTGYGLAPLL